MKIVLVAILFVNEIATFTHGTSEIDKNGYVMFCPCMGRFGNQADQFLGSLQFAKKLDRTLILPPWVEYPPGSTRSVQVSFDRYFKPEFILKYHRVILMYDFMRTLAPTLWPKGKRVAFCYSERKGSKPDDCNARDGNPFDSFWSTFNIDFDSSEFFQPLYYSVEVGRSAEEWKRRYPADKWPVLAFTGPPSSYPPPLSAVPLHRYAFEFSDFLAYKANAFIQENIRKPFVGIHLRNGLDWRNACEHVRKADNKRQHFFDSPQCLGQNFERGALKYDHCNPSDNTVATHVVRAVKSVKAKSVFIATDSDDLKGRLRRELRHAGVTRDSEIEIALVRNPDSQDPHLDLAILSQADMFIGNCMSSFSAFVVRQRASHDLPSQYFYVAENAPSFPHAADEL